MKAEYGEPWRVSKAYKGQVVMRGNAMVADCAIFKWSDEQCSAHARRITLCTNALVGVPDEVLKKMQPGAVAKAVEALVWCRDFTRSK